MTSKNVRPPRSMSTWLPFLAAVGLVTFGCQPRSDTTSTSNPAPHSGFETGQLSVDQDWQTVDFKQSFTDPVVVAKPASLNGADPTTIRLRNVTAGGFEIRLQEWEYLNDRHSAETVSYLAVERGRRELPGGGALEAGSLETSNSRPGNDRFAAQEFSEPFAAVPVVLSIVGTDADATAVTTRNHNVSAKGFEVILQEEEAQGGGHAEETIYWIAWQPGTSSEAGSPAFEAGIREGVTHEFTAIAFSSAFADPPCFVADMQTANGYDPANLRYRNLTSSGVEVQVDDEESRDQEIEHGPETVGWVALACE